MEPRHLKQLFGLLLLGTILGAAAISPFFTGVRPGALPGGVSAAQAQYPASTESSGYPAQPTEDSGYPGSNPQPTSPPGNAPTSVRTPTSAFTPTSGTLTVTTTPTQTLQPSPTTTLWVDLYRTENAEMGEFQATPLPTETRTLSPTPTFTPTPTPTPTPPLVKVNWSVFAAGWLGTLWLGVALSIVVIKFKVIDKK